MPRVQISSIVLLLLSAGFTFGWKYNDEENWPNTCKEGKKQSPISLSKSEASEVFYTAFIWDNYFTNENAHIKNNGHSTEVRVAFAPENRPEVKGGNLPNVYVLDHLHFHWHSEHTVNGYRYPLELHLVHYGKQFGNLSNALAVPQGVAVFGVLFDYSPDDDLLFKPLISLIDKVKSNYDVHQLKNFNVLNFLPRNTAGYYRYEGSLTTPACTEGILWTVFTSAIPISKNQANIFSEIRTKDNVPLSENYRSLQGINGRDIFIKVSPLGSSASAILPSMSSVMLFAIGAYLFTSYKNM